MPSLLSSLGLLALAASALAGPLQRRSAFSTEQVAVGEKVLSGPLDVLKTFKKYNALVPTHVQDAADAVITGSAPAIPQQFDALYLTPVTIGSGGNTLNLDFDTGSSDLWVFSSLQASSQRQGHNIYDVSSGKKIPGASWKIQYADKSGAQGSVYVDKVTVGGVTATTQAVEAAESISTQFQQETSTDGLLGLSFSTINTVTPRRQKTFFDSIKSQLQSPIFAVTLKKGAPGTYDFGFIDQSKFSGNIVYTAVDSAQGFWKAAFDGFAIGPDAPVSSKFVAIPDTGTSLAYLPTSIVNAYYQKVPGAKLDQQQGGFVLPCTSSLPDFSVVLQGRQLTIPGSYLNFAPVDATNQVCFGGLQTNDGLGGLSILGDVFLKAVYTVFESGNSTTPRVGFAPQSNLRR